MLNFPFVGTIKQNCVTLACTHLDDPFEVDFKTCKEALKACNEAYNEIVWGAQLKEKCTHEFYSKHFTVAVDFHNSDDVLLVETLEHLIELARDC